MRAVKCKDNQISLINKFETQLYDQAEMFGVLKLHPTKAIAPVVSASDEIKSRRLRGEVK